jgi:adhesin/invasin
VTLAVLLLPLDPTAAAPPPAGVRTVPVRVVVSAGGASEEVLVNAPVRLPAAKGQTRPVGQPLRIVKAGRHLATVSSLELEPGVDPSVALSFVVLAGSATTTFMLTAAPIAVGATNPWASATASLSATDNNSDGVTLTGLQAGGHAYDARYNSGATVWTGLLGSLSAGAGGTPSATDQRPASGWEQIPATVTDIDAQWRFSLTAFDSASGSATFNVALAGLAASIAATAGTPQAAPIGLLFAQALEATVTDALGLPVVGETVTFTAPAAGASGTFPAGNTAVTDGSGRASVPFTANAIAGAYAVTANVAPPLTPEASFALANLETIPVAGGPALALLAVLVLLLGLLVLRRVG